MQIVGASALASGREFTVGVERGRNTVYWLDGGEPITWKGDEITCCTGCGTTIVCPSIGSQIYLISGDQVSSIEFESAATLDIFGICQLSTHRALACGSRGLLVAIDLETQVANAMKASSLGLRKPGRDIINVFPFSNGVAAIGKRELIYTFSQFPDSAKAFCGTGKEVFFFSGCELSGALWLSGLVGRTGILAKYVTATGNIEYFETPTEANGRAFSIAAVGNNLVIANKHVFVGSPNHWKKKDGVETPECVAILAGTHEKTCKLLTLNGEIFELIV